MKVGVLGGTFDPVHIGHLIIAEEARVRLGLARVLFVPAGRPWLKPARRVSAARHRLAMVRLAIASNPFFELSTVDVDRPGPSYTVDTLADLRIQAGPRGTLYFIMGYDALLDLPRWHDPARLVRMCRLVVVRRPEYGDHDLAFLDREVAPGASRRVTLLDRPLVGVSASELRRRVARGQSIRYWAPDGVEEYIREHGLYRAPGGRKTRRATR
ncbi:MAG: nicotinate-nucleotide adenylyltransferase [Dehalococcoidia bacterium]|nr:nicotinate-nucleotide adenylyltransferase [Dehalococcoidia bacterium]